MRFIVFSQSKIVTLVMLIFTACGDKEGFNVPGNNSNQNNTNPNPLEQDCDDEWVLEDGVWVDPVLCIAWSSKSTTVNWQEASEYCGSNTEAGVTNWIVPSLEELEDMSLRLPPFDDLDGDLWSTDVDSNSGLVWTVNLAQPGMTILLEPGSSSFVRCVGQL
jgi:hypothetical protein